jgi:DNA primase
LSRRIEWPRNSGRFADYEPDELAMVSELLNSGRRGVHLEVELIHAFKVEFPGARFVPSERLDRMSEPFPADTAGTTTLEDR